MNLLHSELAGIFWTQLWQVTALIVAVGLLTRFACRRRPHLAYVLWMLVVVKCLTPPLWSSPVGVFSWAQVSERRPSEETPTETVDGAGVAPALVGLLGLDRPVLERRLAATALEMEKLPMFDYAVVNHQDEIDQAVAEIKAIIAAEKCRLPQRHISLKSP